MPLPGCVHAWFTAQRCTWELWLPSHGTENSILDVRLLHISQGARESLAVWSCWQRAAMSKSNCCTQRELNCGSPCRWQGCWQEGHPGNATRGYLLRMADESSPGSSCTAAKRFCSLRLYPAAQWETQRSKEILLSLRLSDPRKLGKERRVSDNHCFSKECCFWPVTPLVKAVTHSKCHEKYFSSQLLQIFYRFSCKPKSSSSGKRTWKHSRGPSLSWATALRGCSNPAPHSSLVSDRCQMLSQCHHSRKCKSLYWLPGQPDLYELWFNIL